MFCFPRRSYFQKWKSAGNEQCARPCARQSCVLVLLFRDKTHRRSLNRGSWLTSFLPSALVRFRYKTWTTSWPFRWRTCWSRNCGRADWWVLEWPHSLFNVHTGFNTFFHGLCLASETTLIKKEKFDSVWSRRFARLIILKTFIAWHQNAILGRLFANSEKQFPLLPKLIICWICPIQSETKQEGEAASDQTPSWGYGH